MAYYFKLTILGLFVIFLSFLARRAYERTKEIHREQDQDKAVNLFLDVVRDRWEKQKAEHPDDPRPILSFLLDLLKPEPSREQPGQSNEVGPPAPEQPKEETQPDNSPREQLLLPNRILPSPPSTPPPVEGEQLLLPNRILPRIPPSTPPPVEGEQLLLSPRSLP